MSAAHCEHPQGLKSQSGIAPRNQRGLAGKIETLGNFLCGRLRPEWADGRIIRQWQLSALAARAQSRNSRYCCTSL